MKKLFLSLIAFLFLMHLPATSFAQQNRILVVSDYSYEYIKRLQMRGHLLELNPTSLPYTYGEVQSAISSLEMDDLSNIEKSWVSIINRRVKTRFSSEDHDSSVGIELAVASTISDTKRLNTLRPLRNKPFIYPKPNLRAYMENERFVGELMVEQNFYYDQDPDGIDAARRLYVRSEDSYLGYQHKGVKIYAGRFSNHWAPYKESSVVISDNPRSFDQINITFAGKYFSFQGIVGELNNLNESGGFSENSFRPGSKRRFFVGHRFDWRPSKYFGMTFFESLIYSGQNSILSLKNANPLMVLGFVSDNAPKNDEYNLLLGGMLWGQYKNLTLNSQLLLDDIQTPQPDINVTFTDPVNFSFTASANLALDKPFMDVGVEFEAVGYQTYNTDQAEGRYLYLNRGIATQQNDYVITQLYADTFLDAYVSGLKAKPYLTLYWKGEQEINQPYVNSYPNGDMIDIILTGTVERTTRAGLNLIYNPNPWFWVELDTGYNSVNNKFNILNATEGRFSTIFNFGFRLAYFHGN